MPDGPAARLPSMHRLCRQRRGGALVEFALAAPVLFLTIVGMLEVAMIMFITTSVERGLRDAARFGITGSAPEGSTREEQILAILESRTLGMIDLSAAEISFMVYESFNDVEQPEPFTDLDGDGTYDLGEPFIDLNGNGQWDEDRGIEGVGNAGEVVQYRIQYDWPMMTPLIGRIIGTDGKLSMRASVAVRNEPWDVLSGGG